MMNINKVVISIQTEKTPLEEISSFPISMDDDFTHQEWLECLHLRFSSALEENNIHFEAHTPSVKIQELMFQVILANLKESTVNWPVMDKGFKNNKEGWIGLMLKSTDESYSEVALVAMFP